MGFLFGVFVVVVLFMGDNVFELLRFFFGVKLMFDVIKEVLVYEFIKLKVVFFFFGIVFSVFVVFGSKEVI